MNRQFKAEIIWSYPKKLESAINSEICVNGWGIYYISRKFGKNETLLYIGLTFHQTYINRIKQHHKKWINKYRGQIFLRFGEFVKPVSITKNLIEDVESCLIYELDPVQNVCKKRSYRYTRQYIIKNTGYRGVIPQEISIRNHCI